MPRRDPSGFRSALLALAILLSFAGVLAEGWLVHTDDGCTVEIHCTACRWAQGAVPTLALALAFSLWLRAAEPVHAGGAGGLLLPAPSRLGSRGPPLA